ncbi:MAG: alpha/beta hydrolase [archaeon]|nr:alpha/beta hydrolase [archaeon]
MEEPSPATSTTHRTVLQWETLGSYLEVRPGLRMFYRVVEGTAVREGADQRQDETLVLIHGFPTSSIDFERALPLLSNRFQKIVLFDHPGFGLSDKPTAASDFSYSITEYTDAMLLLLEKLDISQAHFLGHDMGDSVLTELATRQARGLLPCWFKGAQSLTFTNGGMRIELASFRVSQILLQVPLLRDLLAALQNAWFFDRQIRSISGTWDALPQTDLDTMYAALLHKNGNYRLPATISYLQDRYRFQNQRWIPALQQLSAQGLPVHICWGANDAVAPVSIAHRLHADLPESKLTILPGLGHFAMLESPTVWANAILSHGI